jgi:hypothetical protein
MTAALIDRAAKRTEWAALALAAAAEDLLEAGDVGAVVNETAAGSALPQRMLHACRRRGGEPNDAARMTLCRSGANISLIGRSGPSDRSPSTKPRSVERATN